MRSGALHQLQERFSARPASATYVRALVGNTPLLAVHCHYRGKRRTIFAKAEHLNLTGSIKDRMALHILSTARAAGELKPGDTIAEATSGNTGISFAALGDAFGNKVRIFMPDWMSQERIALIRSYGAERGQRERVFAPAILEYGQQRCPLQHYWPGDLGSA